MCNQGCMAFGRQCLTQAEVRGKRVIEVGAQNIDGSLRPGIEALGPKEYIGIDLVMGRGVDEVCDANDMLRRFGPESFDLLVSTEMIEHARDWRNVIANFKGVVRRGGFLLLTTRSPGFRVHNYPHDYWRFEPEDLRAVFSDFITIRLESDPGSPGAFLFATKPQDFAEKDLSHYELYSTPARRRVPQVSAWHMFMYYLREGSRWLVSIFRPATARRIVAKRLPGKAR